MNYSSATIDTTLEKADDEILNYTVSDEALEAAAGTEPGQLATAFGTSVCRDCF